MAEAILDKASYSIVRTNPKLTGNVKLLTNGNDLYLESFNANAELSSSAFKAFKIDGTLTYDHDVFSFFKKGSFPSELAYEVFQEFKDTSVLSSYSNQYEMFYTAGTRSLSSESYAEDMGLLAPLWLNSQLPKYFVVFRINDPASINVMNSTISTIEEVYAQTSEKFNDFILNNCTAVKTFDLSNNSKLGSYIRRYREQENFPKSPLTVSWRKDEPIQWNGISYYKGGFASAGNFSYDSLITKDSTIIQSEHFFTQGFQRNGIILANLINLEFLFSDEYADEYSINRYFGLYVDEIEEGSFKLSGNGFYECTEKTQIPKLKTINDVSKDLNSPLKISNSAGVLLHLDESSIETITGIPTPNRINTIESIFYIKDKNKQFHTVKKGSNWNKNQIRLFDTAIDISVLTGFKKPNTFIEAKTIKKLGRPTAFLNIIGKFPDGSSITFYERDTKIGEISANESLTNGPGTYYQTFFNPNGTPNEIAKAIVNAIRHGINYDRQWIKPSLNNSTVYLESIFSGVTTKQLKFKLNWEEYPDMINSVVTYPRSNLDQPLQNFVGGTDKKNSLLLVKAGDQRRFTNGSYIKTKAGFTTVSDWTPYLEEPIISGNGTQIGYRNIDDFIVLAIGDNQIEISNTGQLALYEEFMPSFGRFSIYPIKDLDFDFYSERYSNIGELQTEQNRYASNTGISQWTDISNFYTEGGFSNLIGLLKDADPDIQYETNIKSEYSRLEENFLKEQAIASRITPYINKWVWFDGGTDVRNNPYRLNLSLAFGVNNFSPSKWNIGRSADGFTHEWYYLGKIPPYFTSNDIENTWSYSNETPIDNIENSITQTFQPGTFQRTDIDMFREFFIVDRLYTNDSIVPIDRQMRYGRFDGGNSQNFAEAFFRGVRVIAKTKSSAIEKANFNAKKLSYITDSKFNDYLFSAILIVNEPNKPKNQIKIVKNDKWKTITMMIFVSFENNCLNESGKSIDRTSLYAMINYVKTDSECNQIGNAEYNDTKMQGAINFLSSAWSSSTSQWLIQGTTDINGNPTSFLGDITIGGNGQFNSITFYVGGDVFTISGITKVLSNDQLYATTITKNSIPFTLPSPSPTSFLLRSADYVINSGGFNGYSFALDNIGFANIFNAVNEGDPTIIYETINIEGNQVLNTNGSLAQTFSIELRAQDDILKSNYIGVLPDPNKPTIFNLLDIIGYDLTLVSKPSINPIARHSGWFKPLANDIIFFRDPYIDVDLDSINSTGSTIDDAQYKHNVFNLCRYKNTQFNSRHKDFAMIKRLCYHKVNQEDPSSVLELSADGSFLSLYPLINEVGIGYRDFYIFSSNWEPGYYIKSIDKSKIQSIIGTRSMVEKKSFFASKYLKVPREIILETFDPIPMETNTAIDPSLVNGTLVYNENLSNTEFYLLIQKRLSQYLFEFIKPIFERYINPAYSVGNELTIEDDIYNYIDNNILSLYKIGTVDFYVKQTRDLVKNNYTTVNLTNEQKLLNGLAIDRNISSKTLNTNLFDTRLIYNKRGGFSDSYGFSVTIVKK